MFVFLESDVFILRVLWETHPQETERTEEATQGFEHKGRSRLVVEAEMPGGQHILILMHFRVCSYASLWVFGFLLKIMHIGLMNRRVLCLCFLWGCDRMHLRTFVYMPYRIFPRGEAAVQRLIDAGALICWKEENGLEMVAEFTRSVGGNQVQKKHVDRATGAFFF